MSTLLKFSSSSSQEIDLIQPEEINSENVDKNILYKVQNVKGNFVNNFNYQIGKELINL